MECTAQIEVTQQRGVIADLVDEIDLSLSHISAYASLIEDVACSVFGDLTEEKSLLLQAKLFALSNSIQKEMKQAMSKSDLIHRKTIGH